MNERIKQLAKQAWIEVATKECHNGYEFGPNGEHALKSLNTTFEKFAELIVRECADAADMAQDAGCEYAGDYVAEYMGYGQEEGVTEWRAK
jgi:hypothetical protein